MPFEAIIGLEVHAQLQTASKLFCLCSTEFGAPPNSHTCPVCLGLPGALPVLNRRAVAMAIKTALALDCRINRRSLFARKNYFYPDLPKGYQISQYEQPLAQGGTVTFPVRRRPGPGDDFSYQEKSVGIIRVHLEDDAGKSIHRPGDDTYVNLNRTGVPLIEIVTEPGLRSSREAYDFLIWLRRTLLYLGICDGNMEQGSLRCDANVSVRPDSGAPFGTKTEIKNLNSFRFLQKALDYEIERQVRVIRAGDRIEQETRLWAEARQQTLPMRSKEHAHDYRYFPDPDLMPILISESWLEKIESEIPELPEARRQRLACEYGLSDDDAFLITQTRPWADYFEAAALASSHPKTIFNWMVGDLTRFLKRDNRGIELSPVPPGYLASLVDLIENGQISGKSAKDVFEKVYESGRDPKTIVAQEGLKQITNGGELDAIIQDVLEANQPQVARYRSGKTGLLGFFVGQVMQRTQGQANPRIVNQILKSKLQPEE